MKIIIAKPFTNHSITGCGINLTNFQNLNNQNRICKIHIKTKVANKYSIQCIATSETITTAKAQVAQEIIHGLHQKTAVTSQTIKAACNQTIGLIQATNENAIASGTSASATVNHDKISVFN
jgi:hypothetical protein